MACVDEGFFGVNFTLSDVQFESKFSIDIDFVYCLEGFFFRLAFPIFEYEQLVL